MGGAHNGSYGGARQHRGSGGNGGMVMSTAPAAPNNVYYHYVPVPNPPLYYTQPQQYPTSPVSRTAQDLNISNIYETALNNYTDLKGCPHIRVNYA